jgi:hypothetical protein
MNSTILLILGIILLGYGGVLHSRSDKNYVYFAGSGLVIILIGSYIFFTKSTISKRENFKNSDETCSDNNSGLNKSNSSSPLKEAFDNSVKSVNRLMAVMATPTGNCIVANQSAIDTAHTQLRLQDPRPSNSADFNLRTLLTVDWETFTGSPEWTMLNDGTQSPSTPPPTEIDTKRYYTDLYNKIIADINAALTTRRGINQWRGLFSCQTACTNTNSGSTYSVVDGNAVCSCPAQYFPTLDGDNFVTCELISGELRDMYQAQYDAVNTQISVINGIVTTRLNLRCNNKTCPTTVTLTRELRLTDFVDFGSLKITPNSQLPQTWNTILITTLIDVNTLKSRLNDGSTGSTQTSRLQNFISYISSLNAANMPILGAKYIGIEMDEALNQFNIRYGNRLPTSVSNITSESLCSSTSITNCSRGLYNIKIYVKSGSDLNISAGTPGMYCYTLNWN